MGHNENLQKADPLGGIIPQELVTGDILRGRGPRRGNLERLLRYWRPIMKKPGGFRRCRVILANHPELYPLERICAWLHHETTGKWPNEGCHHPGMKNCKGKLRKPGWTNMEFAGKLRGAARRGKKNEEFNDVFFHEFKSENNNDQPVVTESDMLHAYNVLSEFVEMEPTFSKYLRDNSNWELVGDDEYGNEINLGGMVSKSLQGECCD